MTEEYETWYDLITRCFISPINPAQVDSGYQPGDAYFRRVVGLSIDDQPRETVIKVVKKSTATAEFLYKISLKTLEQQQHHSRFSTRRRQQKGDDQDEAPPPYMAYQPYFMETLFDGHQHQYEEAQTSYNMLPIAYMGYSLPESMEMTSSHVPPEISEEHEDDEDYQIRIAVRHHFAIADLVLAGDVYQWNSGLRCDIVLKEVQICFSVRFRSGVLLCTEAYLLRLPAVEDSDLSKGGSAGLLLLRRFVLYLFRRLAISWKKIAKEATLCSLLEFEQICFSVQVLDLCARDPVVVIVAQKVKVIMVS
ncbi:ubiquitin-protein ligase [Dorcoceras hygrometricum]|uniref:Ubiquitin-protein ligase n=1 Tax=Dorcoceras hygrometricum TaxID=472368 RepID=A0A2Z7AU73_9LAMI|nr:ubiquitin-protein ligase [Dorcoceras hygrometricum]